MPHVGGGESDERHLLRKKHYNATVKSFRHVTESLAIMRVAPDLVVPPFEAGQYTVLGLTYREPRVESSQAEARMSDKDLNRLARRAYSVSCPILDDNDKVVTVTQASDLEFYIALVAGSDDNPPVLTPRLFALREGDRIHLGPRFHGTYTLQDVNSSDHVAFLSTGTGEAPHNAMLAELLRREHKGRIVSVVCTRLRNDLAYLNTHRRVESMFSNYAYSALTTREPENVDPSLPGFIGKRYIQDYFLSGELELDAGFRFDSGNTHVFLCGNPAMIGATKSPAETTRPGMVELLSQRGFIADKPRYRGNIHFEKYW